MPDWLPAAHRAAFANTLIDRDILEELAQHAEIHLRSAARRRPAARTKRLRGSTRSIAAWRSDPRALHRVDQARAGRGAAGCVGINMLAGALADAVYGVRLLRAQPGAALVTILTIALGVGAVTTLFSVAYGVLLRPLPWGDTERLVRLSETRGGREGRVPGTMMNGSYLRLGGRASDPRGHRLLQRRQPGDADRRRRGDADYAYSRVTPSTIRLLGVPPVRGRIFEVDRRRSSQRPNRPSCLSHTDCGNNASACATTSSGNRSCLTACNTRLSE